VSYLTFSISSPVKGLLSIEAINLGLGAFPAV